MNKKLSVPRVTTRASTGLRSAKVRTGRTVVEVTGASESDVRKGLRLVLKERLRAADSRRRAALASNELSSAYRARFAGKTSEAQETAVQRAAEHRRALVQTDTYSYDDLAAIRGAKPSTIRSRAHRSQDKILSVTVGGQKLLPAFQFNNWGELERPVAEINQILKTDETMDDWAAWAWWYSATSFLSGESPIDVIGDDPERVRLAAQRSTERHVA